MPSRTIKGGDSSHVLEVTSTKAARTVLGPRLASDWTEREVGSLRELEEPMLDSAGSQDMNVDGSTTNVDFTAAPGEDRIKWITGVTLVIHDEQLALDIAGEIRRFGSVAAAPGLTNGVLLIARQGGEDENIFSATEGGNPGVRNVTQFFRFGEVFGITGGVAASIDFLRVIVTFPKPIGLYPGTSDALILRVQDDLTALNLFEATAHGYYQKLEG